MKGVTDTGARLGVDNLGTGYASLPLLQRLHVDAVCIDRQLIAAVPSDGERAGLARALVALAPGLNFEVVAKRVENHAQREFLPHCGCPISPADLLPLPAPATHTPPSLPPPT